MHRELAAAGSRTGTRLECHGDVGLLDGPRRALLVSRGERAPQPDTPWLAAVVAATQRIGAQKEILVTGVDRTAFDAALWVCTQHGGAAIVVLQGKPRGDEEWHSFLPPRHLLVWPQTPARMDSVRRQRDLLIGALADRAYAINVRRGGHMAAVAEDLAARRCPLDAWPAPTEAHTALSPEAESPALPSYAPQRSGPWEYLTHFTREPDGAWPGEAREDYLRWLCAGTPFEPRNAFAALCRILTERRIRACGRLMPGRTPMVCFSASPPEEILKLRRWRPGLLRWSFTPYGLAIKRTALERLGARPVTYAPRKFIAAAPASLRPFMQPEDSGKQQWAAEAEWRVAGDVLLSGIAREEFLALTATTDEALGVQQRFGVEAKTLRC